MTDSIITKEQYVLNLVRVGVEQMMCDDRMIDQTLPLGEIQEMISDGQISVVQLVNEFKLALTSKL